jgi:hypothetical protein
MTGRGETGSEVLAVSGILLRRDDQAGRVNSVPADHRTESRWSFAMLPARAGPGLAVPGSGCQPR